MAKGVKRSVFYRTVKFEIKPSPVQENILREVSQNLGLVWNDALSSRRMAFEHYKYKNVHTRNDLQMAVAVTCNLKLVSTHIKVPTLFDQINNLTKKRAYEVGFDVSPRNWQEETLDRLDGSFKSFFALNKHGDQDARPPRLSNAEYFQVIPGRASFSVESGMVMFAKNIFNGKLSFPIPEYQKNKLKEGKVKKFVIARFPADLSKEGAYFVSVTYEIGIPVLTTPNILSLVYVALGASSIGVCTEKSDGFCESVIPFWRPDKHWKPKIDAIKKRLDDQTLKKGSHKHRGLLDAYRTMNGYMAKQQQQNHREMVQKLLLVGKHFVVTDYVVRSKKGKLADAKDADRSGSQGFNWAAQNTGSFLHFLMQLEEKVKEVGGSVVKHRLTGKPPSGIGIGNHNKVAMAHHLRNQHLAMSR